MALADDGHDLVPGALEGGAGRVHRVVHARGLEEALHGGDLLRDRGGRRADWNKAEVYGIIGKEVFGLAGGLDLHSIGFVLYKNSTMVGG